MSRLLWMILVGFLWLFLSAGYAGAVSYAYTGGFSPDSGYSGYIYSRAGSGQIRLMSLEYDLAGEEISQLSRRPLSGVGGNDSIVWQLAAGGDVFIVDSEGLLVQLPQNARIYGSRTEVSAIPEKSLDAGGPAPEAKKTSPIAESAAMGLFGLGLVCLAGVVRRMRSSRKNTGRFMAGIKRVWQA